MWGRIGIGALIVMGGLLLVILCTMWIGGVQGEEFSPDTFQRRRFSYFELPLLRVQVTPIDRIDITNSLEKHLTANGFIAPQNAASPQWDLVTVSSSSEVAEEGDALALCNYLDAVDSNGGNFWLQWTKDNDAKAKVLWPEAARLARQQLYILLPDLFRAAKGPGDAAQLRAEIARIAAQRCVQLAAAQQQLEEHEIAVELFSQALEYEPQNADYLQQRAASYASLGQQQQAQDDLAKAKEFID